MQKSLKSLRAAALLAATVLITTACGDSGSEQSSATQGAPASTAGSERSTASAPAAAEAESMSASASNSSAAAEAGVTVDADGVAQVRIGGTDSMQYTLREFEVEAGQSVELTLTHQGRLGAQVMGHNVVILTPGNDPVAFGARVMEQGGSPENDYVPQSLRDMVVAYTGIVGGGESVTISFTAPEEAGSYAFVCTFPGHYAAMNGVMTVI